MAFLRNRNIDVNPSIRVIRGQKISANNSAFALFDESDDFCDFFGLGNSFFIASIACSSLPESGDNVAETGDG
jgi:hypothetical protein